MCDNLKFEKYIICFEKHPIFRNYLLSCYDDSSCKSILKKYINYIIYLFCELLCKYFYDIIFYLDEQIEENLKLYLLYQNVYMNVLYPEMYIKKDMNFLDNEQISINTYKKSNLFFNAEISINTGNHNIYINNIIDYISEIIRNHMKENKIDYNFDFSNFHLLNNDTFNNMIYIIKNLPLYKYTEEDLIFKDVYSIKNEHNLNYSFIIMNDINLYKYFSLYMFLIYYKYRYVRGTLKNIITKMNDEYLFLTLEHVSDDDNRDTCNKEGKKDNNSNKYYNDDKNGGTYCNSNYFDFDFGKNTENNLSMEDLIQEYFIHKERYKDAFCKDNNDMEKFEYILDNLKNKDKNFFLKYMMVNILHPYSNNLKRKLMWMIKEYIHVATFNDNVIQFFFYSCFINLFYFEKHIKLNSFETLIHLMYIYGIPSKILYNDFREVLIFLFFQLLILFIKKESDSIDSLVYEDNRSVILFSNYEKMNLLRLLKGIMVKEVVDNGERNDENNDNNNKHNKHNNDNNINHCVFNNFLEFLYNKNNCFSDNFINDVICKNFYFYFYLEKLEENNLNRFLKFISLFYQNEINNNIFLFINLLNESLLDIIDIRIPGKDEEYNFLRILKFFSFFLEHYKNTCSTQDVLIVKILQNENFIIYFKSIILNIIKKNSKKKSKGMLIGKEKHCYILHDEILNQIYYILYIFTKKSLFNYKIFWFYFKYAVACISNDLNFFRIEEYMNIEEKLYNMPIYIFQFFNNLIRRDILYVFVSLGIHEPFESNDFPLSLIEILRKVSLLYLVVSDENMNEQTFCYNSIVEINGLYLYNNILSYLVMLLIGHNIFFTYPLWFELNRSYEIIQEGNVLRDLDECVSNNSFKKYGHAMEGNDVGSKMCLVNDGLGEASKEFGFYDIKMVEGGEKKKLRDVEYVNDMDEKKNVEYTLPNERNELKGNPNESCKSRGHSDVCEEILFYREMKTYFIERKKSGYDIKGEKRNNEIGVGIDDVNKSTLDSDDDIYDNTNENRNYNIKNNMFNNNDVNINNKEMELLNNIEDTKIAELMNTLYFNIFLLKDKKEEHIRKLLKILKYVNDNFLFYNCQNEYQIYTMNLMIQKKRYIYQSFSMYVFLDIQYFFDILVKSNLFDRVIDDWINDIFYIYQNSDDLKYFILAFSNMLIYLCLYESIKKKRDEKNNKFGENNMNENICTKEEKDSMEVWNEMEDEYLLPFFFFLKNKRNGINSDYINGDYIKGDNINNSSNKLFEEILKKDMIRFDNINEYATNKLREKISKIINALVNIVLILPIPYEEEMKVFNKNLLRRLAPICGERENIKDNNLLKLNSSNSNIINGNKSALNNIQFDDLIQNILFMHLNNYEQKFYERNNKEEKQMNKCYYYNVVHINKFDELKLHGKKVSIHYYFQNKSNEEFIDKLTSECNCNYFKISFYLKKAFSLLTQEGFTNDDLINIIGCSDKYYNFINIISMDI